LVLLLHRQSRAHKLDVAFAEPYTIRCVEFLPNRLNDFRPNGVKPFFSDTHKPQIAFGRRHLLP
jgi:hypothetical protein